MLLRPKTTANFSRTFSNLLKLSAASGFLQGGIQLHASLIKLGLCAVLSLRNQILHVYVKCKEFNNAHKLFDEMTVKNVVTWNTVICGLVDHGSNNQPSLYMGFCYFKRMMLDKVGFDPITLNGLLRACLELNSIKIGRQLHCLVVNLGFEQSCFINSALIDLYGKRGLVKEAKCVFDYVFYKDLAIWNVMLSCYALNSLAEDSIRIIKLMQQESLKWDGFTFSSILNSCATLGSCELGRQIHGLICRLSFDLDVFVAGGLVDMYAKSAIIEDARKAFDCMASKNLVSWNTMIVAYGHQGDGKEAMKLVKEMLLNDFAPDELTLASILSSSGSASASCEIMQVHAYVVKFGFQCFPSIGNAIVNAYSKCGRTSSALKSFNSIPEPNLVAWTALVSGYAFNSLPEDSIKMFERMLSAGVRPDPVAFLSVLSACSHAGLIKEGLQYFSSMIKDYHILPDLEHYACLIDLLGRAGLLDEAFIVLTSLPTKHILDSLGAFIGACKIHGNMDLAKWAVENLLELEPSNPVNYALMSNLYAYEGQWHDVAKMRKLMRDRCDHKVPGCSWVELGGATHMFVSSDKCHPQALEVYLMLRILFCLMRDEYNVSKLHLMDENALDECKL